MRIVVVEDEAPIREGMAKLLSKINPEYELVGKAADGEAGYQLIRELMDPDLMKKAKAMDVPYIDQVKRTQADIVLDEFIQKITRILGKAEKFKHHPDQVKLREALGKIAMSQRNQWNVLFDLADLNSSAANSFLFSPQRTFGLCHYELCKWCFSSQGQVTAF